MNPSTGQQCNFWSWYPNIRLPVLSPTTLPGSDDLEPVSSPPAAASTTLAAAPVAAARTTCCAIGCKSSRLRKDCSRQRCKTHCIELGAGCTSVAHKPSHSVPTSVILQQMQAASNEACVVLPPVSVPSNPPSAPVPAIDPVLLPVPVPSNPPSAGGSSRAPVHASHMAPVFTEQWATEQRIREENRTHVARRLAHAQKVKQTVYVYVWDQVRFYSILLYTLSDYVCHRTTQTPWLSSSRMALPGHYLMSILQFLLALALAPSPKMSS